MPDKTIKCTACGHDFTFTEADQAHYKEKNLDVEPRRCKTCRQKRRVERGLAARPMFPCVCAQCGVDTEVPFPIKVGHVAFCGTCFEK
jgi:CxxC-x17-CxxC domain-containing protein